MSFRSLLNKLGYVESDVKTATDFGFAQGWAAKYSDMSCALQPQTGAEDPRLYGANKVPSTHKLYFSAVNTITEKDRITVDNLTFDIMLVADSAGRGHHNWADLRITETL